MKKKVLAILLAISMTAGLCGCGSGSETSETNAVQESEPSGQISEEEPKAKESDEKSETENKSENSEKAALSGEVTFGSDQASGYDGFEYLMEYQLITDSTESGDEVTYTVFIPKDEYPNGYREYVFSQQGGVEFSVNLDPALESKDNTVAENLEHTVANDWDPDNASDIYYAIDIGEVQNINDDMAVCEVSCILYSDIFEEHTPRYEFYCMRKMPDGITALIKVTVRSNYTDEVPELLAELESFYGFSIGWDTSFVDNKLADFEANDAYNDGKYNMGYMSFELPEGWTKDINQTAYESGSIFAPNGDMESAHVIIQIDRNYVGETDVISQLLSDTDATEELLAAGYTEEGTVESVKVADYGETFIGRTIEITMELSNGSERASAISYMGQVDDFVYEIYYVSKDADETEKKNGRAALDLILKTAELK